MSTLVLLDICRLVNDYLRMFLIREGNQAGATMVLPSAKHGKCLVGTERPCTAESPLSRGRRPGQGTWRRPYRVRCSAHPAGSGAVVYRHYIRRQGPHDT